MGMQCKLIVLEAHYKANHHEIKMNTTDGEASAEMTEQHARDHLEAVRVSQVRMKRVKEDVPGKKRKKITTVKRKKPGMDIMKMFGNSKGAKPQKRPRRDRSTKPKPEDDDDDMALFEEDPFLENEQPKKRKRAGVPQKKLVRRKKSQPKKRPRSDDDFALSDDESDPSFGTPNLFQPKKRARISPPSPIRNEGEKEYNKWESLFKME